MRRIVAHCLVGVALWLMAGGISHAQLSNKPFSFNSSGVKGIGMSQAGRQAIMNKQILGQTPKVLLRTPDGRLMSVQRGDGGLAIVSSPSGEVLPRYRGRGNITSNPAIGAAVFNSYFASSGGRNGYVPPAVTGSSTATVSRWTSTVQFGGPGNLGASSIEQWTALAYYVGAR